MDVIPSAYDEIKVKVGFSRMDSNGRGEVKKVKWREWVVSGCGWGVDGGWMGDGWVRRLQLSAATGRSGRNHLHHRRT